MEWTKLLPGTIARCACGGQTWFRVPPNTVTWWIERPVDGHPVPPAANEYRCRERRCRRVYWGIGVDLRLAMHPPVVAPVRLAS